MLSLRDLLAPVFQWQEVSILCYHSIEQKPSAFTTSALQFDMHLAALKRWGYSFVSLGDVIEWMEDKKVLPKKVIALTFDDGYEDFETHALPLLKKYSAPATLFVIGDPAGADWDPKRNRFLTPEALERLRQEPLVELGFHTFKHPMLDELHGEALTHEVTAPWSARFFAYPGGHYSQEAIDAIRRAGYVAAFSIKPTLVHKNSDKYLMPRNVITKDTVLWELRFACTKALDWYRALWRLI